MIPSLRSADNVQRGIFEDAPRKHIPHTNGAECKTDKSLLGAAVLDSSSKIQLRASGLETGKAYTAEARTRWLLHGFPEGSPSAAKLHPAQAHTHPPTRPERYRSARITARSERGRLASAENGEAKTWIACCAPEACRDPRRSHPQRALYSILPSAFCARLGLPGDIRIA